MKKTDKDINNYSESIIYDSKRNVGKTKKRMKIAIISIVALIIVLIAASFLIDKYYQRVNEKTNEPIDYTFYPVDYSENIFEDEDYISIIENGFIYYTDSSTNLTLGISRENAYKQGDDVAFMVEYIYSIINGNVELYNGFFSDVYYEDNKKVESFTMQKLYDVNITKVASNENVEKGYVEYKFYLEYKILENNGSFRNDIGAGSKRQYISVREQDNKFLIDSISTASFR